MSLGAREISSSLLNMMYKSSVARKVIMLVLICSFCGTSWRCILLEDHVQF